MKPLKEYLSSITQNKESIKVNKLIRLNFDEMLKYLKNNGVKTYPSSFDWLDDKNLMNSLIDKNKTGCIATYVNTDDEYYFSQIELCNIDTIDTDEKIFFMRYNSNKDKKLYSANYVNRDGEYVLTGSDRPSEEEFFKQMIKTCNL